MLLAIALGGIAGTLARYGLGALLQRASATFPVSTLVVNVVGSFVLGVAMRYLLSSSASPEARAAVTIGFCGAFTTFSTFAYEAATLLEDGAYARAAGYAAASVFLSIAAIIAGFAVARLILAPR